VGLLAVNAVVWAVGQAIARSKTSDLSAEDVEIYTFWNGAEYLVKSESLRSAKARILMGGATIDLRQVQPSEQGAAIDVAAVLGGAAVLVPRGWAVEVIEESRAAEVEVRLDPDAELALDAPKVTIRISTSLGGVLVGYELPREARS
jgi:predicted membrane protein